MVVATEKSVLFLDPTGEVRDRSFGLAARLSDLNGKVMGVVDMVSISLVGQTMWAWLKS